MKKDYDKTLTRLISILTMLSENRCPSTNELALEFNVTQRTIQKDLYERLIGFPIEKTNGTFKFIEGFSLNKSLLNLHEMMLLSLSLSQFNNIASFSTVSDNILKKLLYPNFSNPYFMKQHSMENLNINSTTIKIIESAIEQQNNIQIFFIDNGGHKKSLEVEPYKIANFDGFWYLFAKELNTNKIKIYMIYKINKVNILQQKYKTSQKQIEQTLKDVHSSWFDDGEAFEVVIKVYSEISHYFRQKDFLQSQNIIKEYEDGSMDISFNVTHDEDIDNIIKSWLPHIEILKPKRFRNKIINELESYISNLKLK